MKIEVGAKIRKTPTGFLFDLGRHSELFKSVKDLEGTIIDATVNTDIIRLNMSCPKASSVKHSRWNVQNL